MELTFRLIDLWVEVKSTKYFVEQLEKHSSVIVKTAWIIFEDKDKSGNEVKGHYHGYLELEKISMPTFRASFKNNILALSPHIKHLKGNQLYCISLLRKSRIEYLAYQIKNIPSPTYAPCAEWEQSDVYNLEKNISYELYHNVVEYKNTVKNEILNSFEKQKKLKKEIEDLHKNFMDTNYWTFNIKQKNKKCLCEELIKLYIDNNKSFRMFQLKMKLQLWWLTKYPADIQKYVEKYFQI